MPVYKRKPVQLLPVPGLPAANPEDPTSAPVDPDPQVWYLEATGEIFLDYESYLARVFYLRRRIFQCSVTGKANMTFAEAIASEKAEGSKMNDRFQAALKGPVLRSVAFQVEGRLDNLVDRIYDRFKARYWPSENVYVDLQGDKYLAKITKVFPPASLRNKSPRKGSAKEPPRKKPRLNAASEESESELSSVGDEDEDDSETAPEDLHKIGTDLDIPLQEASEQDPPAGYFYIVQLAGEDDKFSGSSMEVKADLLSRDRLVFSKSILKRYLRESLIREASIGAPWIVRADLAQQFGIPLEQPEERKAKNASIRADKLQARKKVVEPKEKPLGKREQKAQERAATAEAKRTAADNDAGKEEKVPAERKKPIKYPIEDLDVVYTKREINARTREGTIVRPKPSKHLLVPRELFEDLLMTWDFLNTFGQPLSISPFSLDDYTNALYHSMPDAPAPLIIEIHAVLLNALIREAQARSHAPGGAAANPGGGASGAASPDKDVLVEMSRGYGRSWDKTQLNSAREREGWESVLIGCLRARATSETLPGLHDIFQHFFRDVVASRDASPAPTKPALADDGLRPEDRYWTLPLSHKIHIINFLVGQASMVRGVRAYIDEQEAELTELRKERVEVNREKKKILAEKEAAGAANGEQPVKKEGEAVEAGTETPVAGTEDGDVDGDLEMHPPSSPLSEVEEDEMKPEPEDDELDSAVASDVDELDPDNYADPQLDGAASDYSASESGSGIRAPSRRAQTLREQQLAKNAEEAMRSKAQQEAREAERKRNAQQKARRAEKKTAEEEYARLEKRSEAIEREFRKAYHVSRVRPLGQDRFYNNYWWLDGIGGTSLQGPGGAPLYGTGRLFIQGPREAIIEAKSLDALAERRVAEEGEEGVLAPGEWAVYEDPEELDALLAWLQAKGHREYAFKNQLNKWWFWLMGGVRKRIADSSTVTRAPEARRSTRAKALSSDVASQAHMHWTNKRAVASRTLGADKT